MEIHTEVENMKISRLLIECRQNKRNFARNLELSSKLFSPLLIQFVPKLMVVLVLVGDVGQRRCDLTQGCLITSERMMIDYFIGIQFTVGYHPIDLMQDRLHA